MNTVEPLYCRRHGTTAVCPDYRGVHISEASGCMLARKADQRLELHVCEPMLLYTCSVQLLNRSAVADKLA